MGVVSSLELRSDHSAGASCLCPVDIPRPSGAAMRACLKTAKAGVRPQEVWRASTNQLKLEGNLRPLERASILLRAFCNLRVQAGSCGQLGDFKRP